MLVLQLQTAPALADSTEAAAAAQSTKETRSSSGTEILKDEWKAWNKTLSEEVFKRIKNRMGIGPNPDYTQHCTVSYVVTQAGKIHLLQIQGSPSQSFRSLVTSALESLQHTDLVKFPEGTNKNHVKKRTEYYFEYTYENQPKLRAPNSSMYSPKESETDE